MEIFKSKMFSFDMSTYAHLFLYDCLNVIMENYVCACSSGSMQIHVFNIEKERHSIVHLEYRPIEIVRGIGNSIYIIVEMSGRKKIMVMSIENLGEGDFSFDQPEKKVIKNGLEINIKFKSDFWIVPSTNLLVTSSGEIYQMNEDTIDDLNFPYKTQEFSCFTRTGYMSEKCYYLSTSKNSFKYDSESKVWDVRFSVNGKYVVNDMCIAEVMFINPHVHVIYCAIEDLFNENRKSVAEQFVKNDGSWKEIPWRGDYTFISGRFYRLESDKIIVMKGQQEQSIPITQQIGTQSNMTSPFSMSKIVKGNSNIAAIRVTEKGILSMYIRNKVVTEKLILWAAMSNDIKIPKDIVNLIISKFQEDTKVAPAA
jgi:hypothetical protein